MTHRHIEPRTELGWRVIDVAVSHAQHNLGRDLVSAYAIGSLAHGGFSPAVSDVDLALLTSGDSDMPAAAATIMESVGRSGVELGDRLSLFHVPWTLFGGPPDTARFPPIDRYDLVRYGILVSGTDLRATYATLPTAHDIRVQAVESALHRVTSDQIAADLKELADHGIGVHDATKLVLWPVRLQHVCDLGHATGNSDAVHHYLKHPDARHADLVADALSWRDLGQIPDPTDALERISAEINDLHVEVFENLGSADGVPRSRELLRRGRELSVSQAPGSKRP